MLDRGDAADLIDVARHELGLSKTEKRFPRKDTCLAIYSHRVNTGAALRATLEVVFPWCAQWEDELARLFRNYVERKLASQALDYDDLLLYWDAIMADASLAADIGGLFDHVPVDEYQDTNALQADILKALARRHRRHRRRSDRRRSIRSAPRPWKTFSAFRRHVRAHAAVVALEQNYRSTQRVLDAANALSPRGAPVSQDAAGKAGQGERPR